MLDLDMNMSLFKLKVDDMKRMLSHITSSKSPQRNTNKQVNEYSTMGKLTIQADMHQSANNGLYTSPQTKNTNKNHSDLKKYDLPRKYNLDYIFVQESGNKEKTHIKNISSR
jgi:hypothetical protein